MTATLYGDLLAAGVLMHNNASELYVQDTAVSRAILARWPDKAKLAARVEHAGGHVWQVPFDFVGEVIEPGDLKD
jgi:hypothetical protein